MKHEDWPKWTVWVTVDLGGTNQHRFGWEVQAATVAAAIKRGPDLAARELTRLKVKGRSKIQYMRVDVTKCQK